MDEAASREDDMAKGRMRPAREKKKPKADKNKKKKGGPAPTPSPFGKFVPDFFGKKTS
jgi:hypothetical protein